MKFEVMKQDLALGSLGQNDGMSLLMALNWHSQLCAGANYVCVKCFFNLHDIPN